MSKIILLILISTIFMSLGNVCFKKGVGPIESPRLRSGSSYLKFLGQVFQMPMIWLGLVTVIIGIVVWLIALAQTDLSVAYPIDSLQYIMTLFAANIFLGEKIDKMKIMGTALVISGIVLISLS